MKKDQNKGVPITFSSGPLVQTIQTKKMKLKHLARKGEVEKLTISEAKRRTAERQEEDNQKKMCLGEGFPLDAEAKGASLYMAPKVI